MKAVRILIVEDENIAAELLQSLLRNLGYEVCGVTPFGEDAVEKALTTTPDLILMDIKLRGQMTGVEAAAEIRKQSDVPILYLTAYNDDETLERAKVTQPFGYIQKPFRGGELHSAIEISLYRHRLEQQLKEREHSYRVLADNLPGILYRLSLVDGSMQFFNAMLPVITGYAPDELARGSICSIDTLIVDEDREMVMDVVRHAVAANIPFQVEYRIRHKSGESRYVTEQGRPVCGGNGTPLHIDGMIFDITERRKVEEELKQAYKTNEERRTFFESVIANIQSGIMVTDPGMRIMLANPYGWRLFNKSSEEIVGRHLREICPEIHERIMAGIDSDEIPVESLAQDLVMGFSRFNLKGLDRAVVGHIINFKDLTEIVKIRGEMRKKERLSAMGEVVARVAHEMRNPLFGMTAVGQILDMELPLNASHKQLMDSFLKEAKRLNNLVEELLECTRELRLSKKNVNLLKIVEASLRVNEPLAKDKAVTFEKSFPPEELRLFADPEKVEQVLLNLMKNAIEASTTGGTVRVIVAPDGATVSVKVIDEGQGIKPELVDKIFDVFYTTKKNGTGMGLSISKSIVEAHGGTLTACNNADRGAMFTAIFPLNGKDR
ncbi:MAG TPA: ATP-binding protein [Geobacteraceae bacterium]